ncbi:ABC transporter permease [Phaeacidiphilus oryzae]|uniref:ABC transporter permease n=1 Tax=Phaeacidiphilus oryzae TaxID=348818 RepID=UPI000566B289|nr:ABC transporter permease [Phaeacidiphilus oryzae]
MSAATSAGAGRPLRGELAGSGLLTRTALRRDRVQLPVWVYVVTASVASTAYSFHKLYPSAAQRESLAGTLTRNGSLRALYGPVFDASTVGGLTAWRMVGFGSLAAGLMSLLLVVRHTRAEEESGRQELIGSAPVGRRAPLTAALTAALTANLALAALIVLALSVLGQGGPGAVVLGLSLAGCGLVMAAVAALAAQATGTSRAANGLSSTVLGAFFVLRAAGDAGSTGGNWLDWLSPIGWAEQTRAYAEDRWWVLALPVVAAVLLSALAYAAAARRDLGAGLLPDRPGPASAAPGRLASPLALAVRLQRGTLLGWTSGFAAGGAVFGSVTRGVKQIAQGSGQLQQIFERLGGERQLVNAYLATVASMLAMIAAAYAVQAVQRLHGEEAGGRAEPLLAGPVSRLRWASGHLLFALAGPVLLLAAGGVVSGAAAGAVTDGAGREAWRMLGACLATLPAVWFTAGATVFLYGAAPRARAAGWALLSAFIVISWVGPAVQLSHWVLDLSPFQQVSRLPGTALSLSPLVWMTALAAVLTDAGLVTLRRRDLG